MGRGRGRIVTVVAGSLFERNLAVLAVRQPELADRLRNRWDDAHPGVQASLWAGRGALCASTLDCSTPVLLFAGDALIYDPPFNAGFSPPLLLAVERHPDRLSRTLRSVHMAPWLADGRLALILAAEQLELMEALKPFLPVLLGSPGPAIVVASGLSRAEAELYRRWGEEAARFVEFSRDPTVLNIEVYQRFQPVADRINALGACGLAVLDVGGREWLFSAFLPSHRVTVADLETTGIDARALPYADGSFDVVTSHHLLEHVAAPDRMRVLAELVRVARKRVLVTGPFEENPFASEIDELLVRIEPGNRYLQEHNRLGLPSLREIESWLSAQGLAYRVQPLTRCNTWLLALALAPFQQTRPRDFAELTRFYNRRFGEFDRGHPAYQVLIEIEVSS